MAWTYPGRAPVASRPVRHAYATTDGGAKWQIQSLPTVAFWLSSITCATTLESSPLVLHPAADRCS